MLRFNLLFDCRPRGYLCLVAFVQMRQTCVGGKCFAGIQYPSSGDDAYHELRSTPHPDLTE